METTTDNSDNSLKEPLYQVLGHIAAFWTLANVGYYFIFPALGYQLSYNSAPIVIALYFLLWAVLSISYFKRLFAAWLVVDSRVWTYVALSFGLGLSIWGLLYLFSLLPQLHGPLLAPYSDILFATPWYFLPKSAEVLVQQILITTLVLELYYRFKSLKKVVIGYALCFGGAHVLLFAFSGAPTAYAVFFTLGALLSSLVFPYLILKVRGGFVYAYAIHLLFYIVLAMLLHTWPPPGYGMWQR